MPDSRPEELLKAVKLRDEAKFDEALHLINNFEKKEALSSNDKLSSMLLKGTIYPYKGQWEESVKIGETAYQMSQKLGKVSETIDALLLKSFIAFLGKPDDTLEFILEAEKLFSSFAGKSSSALSRQKANILYRKSDIYRSKGNQDHALESALQCLELREKLGENLEISISLTQIGILLMIKGESKKALDYFKRSLSLNRELDFKAGMTAILDWLARCYSDLSEFDQALNQWEEMVKIGEEAYQMSQKLGKVPETIDALLVKSFILYLGKPDEALELLLEAEKLLNSYAGKSSSALSRQKSSILARKSEIYSIKADYDRALESALQCLALQEKFGGKFEISESLLQTGWALMIKGEVKKALDYIKKSLTLRRELNFKAGIPGSLICLAQCYSSLGELDQALEICKQVLSFKGSHVGTRVYNFNLLGDISINKGELNQALEYVNQGVILAEKYRIWGQLATLLHHYAWIYFSKGDYEQAKDYCVRSLTHCKKTKNHLFTVFTLGMLILINIDVNSREQAQRYLNELKDFVDQTGSKMYTQRYLLAKSSILRTSGRRRDSVEAEMLLRQIIDDEITTPSIYIYALVDLCSLLLEELSMYNNPILLEDINPLITRLVNFAEEQHSYRWLAEVKLLQAKLKLIQLDIAEAKRLLMQAQSIADSHSLQKLAHNISSEHDSLLEQINLWNSLKKRNAPMSERIKLAVFDDVVNRLTGKRAVESTELIDETPVLLLIILEGGILVFSYTFTDKWKRDTELFGSFLSAFTSFSDEYFSEGLDRAKFGQYTVFMKPIVSYSVCYLFKGQTYLAQQKLSRFVEHIQENESIKQTLDKFQKTSQILELKDFPFLKSLITEIFIKKSPEISTPI